MRDLSVRVLLAATLICGAAAPAWADVDDGLHAYIAGDYATALKEFRALVEQGNADAQYYLGGMYQHGWGVHLNNIKAYMWYSLAMAQGDEMAAGDLSEISRQMSFDQIAEAQRLAAEMWEKINN
jgi:TPR repeat protein